MAVLVLCLNLGRTYTFHCRRKSNRPAKMLGFSCQCSVPVRADLDLISGSGVRASGVERRTSTGCARHTIKDAQFTDEEEMAEYSTGLIGPLTGNKVFVSTEYRSCQFRAFKGMANVLLTATPFPVEPLPLWSRPACCGFSVCAPCRR
jgi:hypothetical protein